MKYKLVIFDLDGTLMDTSEGILSAVQYTIEKTGKPLLTNEQMRSFIGPPVQKSFADIYGLSAEEGKELAAIFRERYSTVDLTKASTYEGMYELLEKLKALEIKSAVATYKREDYALRLLNEYKFGNYMDIMHGSDMEGKLSKTDIINLVIDESGVPKNQVVMIGDTANDAVGAKEAGVDFVAVTYGFGYEKGCQCEDAVAVIDSPLELLNI